MHLILDIYIMNQREPSSTNIYKCILHSYLGYLKSSLCKINKYDSLHSLNALMSLVYPVLILRVCFGMAPYDLERS